METLDRTQPEFWFQQVQIPQRFWGMDFRDYDTDRGDPEALAIAVGLDSQLARGSHRGVGASFVGPPGRGKTMLASIIAKRHILRTPAPNVYTYEPPVEFSTLARFQRLVLEPMELDKLERLPDSDSDDIGARWERNIALRSRYRSVTLLVLDDLGWERRTATKHIERELDLLLRERFDFGLPTVITSNLTLEHLGQEYSPAFRSFLYEATAVVSMPGIDQRTGR